VNELVSSHEPASNAVMNADDKTEFEIALLKKEYAELACKVIEDQKEKS
jgi:hypothetical protein